VVEDWRGRKWWQVLLLFQRWLQYFDAIGWTWSVDTTSVKQKHEPLGSPQCFQHWGLVSARACDWVKTPLVNSLVAPGLPRYTWKRPFQKTYTVCNVHVVCWMGLAFKRVKHVVQRWQGKNRHVKTLVWITWRQLWVNAVAFIWLKYRSTAVWKRGKKIYHCDWCSWTL